MPRPQGHTNHGGSVANRETGGNVPSKEQYARLKTALSAAGAEDIPDYEDVMRPFNVSKDVEFTDVWTFESVRQHKGKHPAGKPVDLLKHALEATSYPGDIVLDCFSGSTGVVAAALGRRSILTELDEKWCERAGDALPRAGR